jgi:hypothetical protein
MSDFTTSASLELQVPDAQLRSTRQNIEQALGGVEASVSTPNNVTQAVTDGGGSRGLAPAREKRLRREEVTLARQRTDQLGDIVTLLEDIEFSGGGGGGGGGGISTLLPDIGGLGTAVGGGLIARRFGGLRNLGSKIATKISNKARGLGSLAAKIAPKIAKKFGPIGIALSAADIINKGAVTQAISGEFEALGDNITETVTLGVVDSIPDPLLDPPLAGFDFSGLVSDAIPDPLLDPPLGEFNFASLVGSAIPDPLLDPPLGEFNLSRLVGNAIPDPLLDPPVDEFNLGRIVDDAVPDPLINPVGNIRSEIIDVAQATTRDIIDPSFNLPEFDPGDLIEMLGGQSFDSGNGSGDTDTDGTDSSNNTQTGQDLSDGQRREFSTASDININNTVTIKGQSRQDIERELDKSMERLKRDIRKELPRGVGP